MNSVRRALCVTALAFAPLPTVARAQTLSLAEALDAALATHPTLAAADARVLASESAGDAARAGRLPAAALTANLTQFQEPMVVAPLHRLDLASPPVFDRTLVQGQVGARYTLFDGGAGTWRVRGAVAAGDATREARSSAEMVVLEEVVTVYAGTVAARSTREAARAQVAALEAERDRAQRHFDAGSAARVEVLRAEAALLEARAAESSASARVDLAERALARAMGVDPSSVSARSLAEVGVDTEVRARSGGASPLVRQADFSVAAAEARHAEERAARLPSVVLGAGVQDFGTAGGDHTLEWRAGVEVSWPLFTGGARSAAVRRAAADLEAARAERATVELRLDQEVDAARTSIVEADARAEALDAAVAQWEEIARIEALALEAGSGEQHDLLRAEAGLFGARAGRALASRDAVVASVRLARAEGTLTRDWITESMEDRR